ncbi:MAG: thiamine phosphate synthase [Planctomycetia bacterium]|nr:thiamine phosphate synthase [Planctomycetia bacterium]
MLFPEITPAVERAILASLAWQQALHANELQSAHLLLGLLHEEDGIPAIELKKQDITLNAVLNQLNVPTATVVLSETLPAALPSLIATLIYQARDLALQSTGNAVVHGEHLLHALLRTDAGLINSLPSLEHVKRLLTERLPDVTSSLPMEQMVEPVESVQVHSLHRILDANYNRAGEALRILEEYARFHLNDAYLSRQFKLLRHEVTTAYAENVTYIAGLRCRDTSGDIGTSIITEAESLRASLYDVFRANMARLQQALRVLEEYGKVVSSRFGSMIERLRYRAYVLEKACLFADTNQSLIAKAQLYLLVSKSSCAASIEWTIQEAVAGGVSVVQLREKGKEDKELLAIAREVRSITSKLGILFIMNDRPDIARIVMADGVHVGQDDLPANDVRKIMGSKTIVGISTHHQNQLERALQDGADYVGIGPVFPSSTKSFSKLAGLAFVRQASNLTSMPRFAIGGIDASNVSKIVQAGIKQVVVGRAITMADDPRSVAMQMIEKLNQ